MRDQGRADHLTHWRSSLFWGLNGPPLRGEHGVLDVAVEVEGPDATLAADSGLAVASEGCAEVTDEKAVHPNGSGVQRQADPFGAVWVAGHQRRRQPEAGVVGHGHALFLGAER